MLRSSFVETTAVQVGLHGHTPDANDHDEGPLPRIAATADHPLLERRHQRRAQGYLQHTSLVWGLLLCTYTVRLQAI